MTPVVTLVGGGVSVASLIDEMSRTLTLDTLDIRLAAQDVEKLDLIADHARVLAAGRRGWSIETCPSAVEASVGADVIVVMIRVGGLAARRADEDLSRRFGVPGDEGLGPGGAANALRTLPVLADLATELRRVAPAARVLNLVAPLGLTTRVLLDGGLDVVGVCELPAVTEAALLAALDPAAGATDTEPPIALAYAGLNHLGWFWPRAGRADTSADVLARFADAGLVDQAVLDTFEAVPLKYYYWLLDPAGADRLHIARDPDRTLDLIDLRDRTLAEFAAAPGAASRSLAARPTPWFAHGLVPMLAGILAAAPWRGFANVRNGELVPGLGSDLVVETRAALDGGGIHPEPLNDPMPPAVRTFVEQVAWAEDLIYRSWVRDDEDLLVDSFVDGPHQFDPWSARRLANAMRISAENPVGAPG